MSTVGDRGVAVPADAVEGLEQGWLVPYATTIPMVLAVGAECLGHLRDPYLSAVIEQASPALR